MGSLYGWKILFIQFQYAIDQVGSGKRVLLKVIESEWIYFLNLVNVGTQEIEKGVCENYFLWLGEFWYFWVLDKEIEND